MAFYDDAVVDVFMGLTQTTRDVAEKYLEVAQGNVDQATELFFENPFSLADLPSNNGNGNGNGNAYRGRRDDDMDWDELDRQASPTYPVDTDGVRAPIPQKRQVLMQEGDDERPVFTRNLNFQDPVLMARRMREAGMIPGSFPFRPEPAILEPFRNFAAEAGDPTSRASKLDQLFQPPRRIMFTGTLEEAKQKGKSSERWLMVSVKKAGEFACEVQNRDLFSDERVQDFIREHFIFLQLHSETQEGAHFIRLYPPNSYPYIAIIDPRTGELVNSLEYAMGVDEFLGMVAEWLSENSLHDNPSPIARKQARRPSPPTQAPSSNQATNKEPLPVEFLSEEEQIEAALAMSLQEIEHKEQPPRRFDVDDDDDIQIISGPTRFGSQPPAPQQQQRQQQQQQQIQPFSPSSPSPQAREQSLLKSLTLPPLETPQPPPAQEVGFKIVAKIREEPSPDDPNITKIGIRMLDGSKAVYRFLTTDPVLAVYQHIKAIEPSLQTKQFELMMHTTKTSDKLNETVAEAKMNGALLVVVLP